MFLNNIASRELESLLTTCWSCQQANGQSFAEKSLFQQARQPEESGHVQRYC